MKLAAALALVTHAVAYDITHSASLNCRAKPTTDSGVVKTYMLGDDIQIVCQIRGQKITTSDIWDQTQDGCYVLDYYVSTGFANIFRPLCSDNSESGSSAGGEQSASSASQDDNSDLSESGDLDHIDSQSDDDSSDAGSDDNSSDGGSDDTGSDTSDVAALVRRPSTLIAAALVAALF
ncbi:hypothetical protein H4R23_001940 [Coemansia sp. Cherry 401B]|nr:hypothetical protein IWW54_005977 [Coemansia sp. RSA 2705]KAJ2310360.1 hypothetical protein IWW52_005440 [Coemansia sp. RSA 2704]KAJ2736847.1 hypothetical protein H4R23_001940 [Coemansia sp. Cherry 401B]